MNKKPLEMFILEEIKNNNYYTDIRVFVSYHRLNIKDAIDDALENNIN